MSNFDTNIDPLAYAEASRILNQGVPNIESTNLQVRCKGLFENSSNFEHTAALVYYNFALATAGNFNKVKRQQNNKANLRYRDVILVINCDTFTFTRITKHLCEGTVFDDFEVMELGRVGGHRIADKLDLLSQHKYRRFRITSFEFNPGTGLLILTGEYHHCTIVSKLFAEDGVPYGEHVCEVRLQDNAPGYTIGVF